MLPALHAWKLKEDRLSIVISYRLKEQFITVLKPNNFTGKKQTQASSKSIIDWNLEDKVQIFCCDTTALNTSHFNGAWMLPEQKFDRHMLFFASCHHVYELVLKAIFKVKIKQVTSFNISLFKKLKKHNIDPTKIQCYRETQEMFWTTPELEKFLDFYHAELKNDMIRDDYREFIKFSIVFLGGDAEKIINKNPNIWILWTNLDK